jgi:Tfp pilus assembly protein PilF
MDASTVALSQKPNDAVALSLKAIALCKSGNPGAAAPLADAAMKAARAPRAKALALTAEGTVSEQNGDRAAATQSYQKANSTDPSLGLTYVAFAEFFHAKGQDGMAKSVLSAGQSSVHDPQEQNAITQLLGTLP